MPGGGIKIRLSTGLVRAPGELEQFIQPLEDRGADGENPDTEDEQVDQFAIGESMPHDPGNEHGGHDRERRRFDQGTQLVADLRTDFAGRPFKYRR